jgi:archaetidylinositol phosphate synthase
MSDPATSPADGAGFREARRDLSGLTSRIEKRALLWLAARMPAAVHSDHLTLLGLAGMVACGVLYALSGSHPWLLLLVNIGLVVNWFGDSLDGTLARYRHRQRPRFGFYVDHMVDAVGALFVLGGLGLSGLMSPLVAAAVLVAYDLLAIETYLATYAIGNFKISWGPFGGTELRIALALVNVAALFWPSVQLGERTVGLFNVLGAPAAAGLALLAVAAGIRGTRALRGLEGTARAPRIATRGPSSDPSPAFALPPRS